MPSKGREGLSTVSVVDFLVLLVGVLGFGAVDVGSCKEWVQI